MHTSANLWRACLPPTVFIVWVAGTSVLRHGRGLGRSDLLCGLVVWLAWVALRWRPEPTVDEDRHLRLGRTVALGIICAGAGLILGALVELLRAQSGAATTLALIGWHTLCAGSAGVIHGLWPSRAEDAVAR